MNEIIIAKILYLFGPGVLLVIVELFIKKDLISAKDDLVIFMTGFLVMFLSVFMSDAENIAVEDVLTLQFISRFQLLMIGFGIAIWMLLLKRKLFGMAGEQSDE